MSWKPFFWFERLELLHQSRVVLFRLLLSSASYSQSLLLYHLPTVHLLSTPTTILQVRLLPTTILQYAYYHIPVTCSQHHLPATCFYSYSRAAESVWRELYTKQYFYRCLYVSKQEIWPVHDIYRCDYEWGILTQESQVIYNYYLTWLCSILHARYTTFTLYLLADTQETTVQHWSNRRQKLSLQLELRIKNTSSVLPNLYLSPTPIYISYSHCP